MFGCDMPTVVEWVANGVIIAAVVAIIAVKIRANIEITRARRQNRRVGWKDATCPRTRPDAFQVSGWSWPSTTAEESGAAET